MRLLSVNIGTVQPIRNGKPSGKTGIFKKPQAGPVHVGPLGLENDAIVDTENHGGLDQAIYLFTQPDYEWWSAHINRPLEPGTFGENMTVSDLNSADLIIGDRLRVGTVLLEVTAPRIPCVTIAARMEDPQFVKKFRRAERPGVYCRVIEPGDVQASDPVELIPYTGTRIGIIDLFRSFYRNDLSADELKAYISVPMPVKMIDYCKGLLAELETN